MPQDTNEKKSIDLTFYAKIMIAVAIALLAYGFYLDVGSERKLIDPSGGQKDDPKKGETITTIDIHHWSDDFSEGDINPGTGKSGSGKTTLLSLISGVPLFIK